MISHHDVHELFLYFTEFHLSHCSFLIRVGSLAELAEHSELLLWTIILIAARHHVKHHQRNQELEIAHSRLRASKYGEATLQLPDLQAILLLCMWPLPVKHESGDISSICIGEAISYARQLGLDTLKDGILFGTRRAANLRALDQRHMYPTRLLRLTWLKCFELDVQLSLWHGILPALAASRYFRSVADFCRTSDIPRTVAQNMDIYVRTARYLLLLDDTPSSEAAWNLAKSFLQGLAFAKENKHDTWSLENELVSETCEMYICMTGYVHVFQQEQGQDGSDPPPAYAKDLLLTAKERAVDVIRRLTALTDECMSKDQSSHLGTTPLPGYPKHTGRVMFFAASVLLKYLDSEGDHSTAAYEKARNAFQEALHFFERCPKAIRHRRAGHTLEVAGRAIAQRQARLQSHVTTRMGASIVHDVSRLSGLLRDRDTERQDPAKAPLGFASLANDQAAATSSSLGIPNVPANNGGTSQWEEWCYPDTEMLGSGMDPASFEMFDSTLDGLWQNDILNEDMNLWDQLLG